MANKLIITNDRAPGHRFSNLLIEDKDGNQLEVTIDTDELIDALNSNDEQTVIASE